MHIDRGQIAAMIPHAGTMCLLDAVVRWDATSIRCLTRCHRRADNPLRRPDGALGAVCGVEIAAQAMALHGRLIADRVDPPVPGYLASVRDVRLRVACLDQVADELMVDAELLMEGTSGASYRFVVGADLLSGRATVMFGVAE